MRVERVYTDRKKTRKAFVVASNFWRETGRAREMREASKRRERIPAPLDFDIHK
jgi:hypothetical protein